MCRKVICAQVLKVGARPRSVRDRRGVIIIQLDNSMVLRGGDDMGFV